MKKLFILAAAIASLSASSALAANGHSLSIEATRVDVDQEFGNTTYLGNDDAVLATIGYGYKFEFDKFFVKPGVYYTLGDVEINDTDGSSDKSTFDPGFSVEADLGYDISSNFGIFATVGIMGANLEREESGVTDDANETGLLYGVGVRYDINDQFSLTAKYQVVSFDYGVATSSNDLEVDVDMIRVGLSYNF